MVFLGSSNQKIKSQIRVLQGICFIWLHLLIQTSLMSNNLHLRLFFGASICIFTSQSSSKHGCLCEKRLIKWCRHFLKDHAKEQMNNDGIALFSGLGCKTSLNCLNGGNVCFEGLSQDVVINAGGEHTVGHWNSSSVCTAKVGNS